MRSRGRVSRPAYSWAVTKLSRRLARVPVPVPVRGAWSLPVYAVFANVVTEVASIGAFCQQEGTAPAVIANRLGRTALDHRGRSSTEPA